MNTINVNGHTVQPSKILCVGRNYRAHIEELGNEVPDSMVVFNKPNSAISDTLRSDIDNQPLHYESELAFTVKGGNLHSVGFGLDLTKRGLQSALKAKGLPWERAKAFDGAALFSAFVTLPKDYRRSVFAAGRRRRAAASRRYKPDDIYACADNKRTGDFHYLRRRRHYYDRDPRWGGRDQGRTTF